MKKYLVTILLASLLLGACGQESPSPKIQLEDLEERPGEDEVKREREEKEKEEEGAAQGENQGPHAQRDIEAAKEVIKNFYKEELDFEVILSYPEDQPFEKYYSQVQGTRIEGYDRQDLILFEIQETDQDSDEIIHPANFIVVGREKGSPKWRVLDFGL